MDTTVVILAGGQGMRMGELGGLVAKTSLVVYDLPLIVRVFHHLSEHSFTRVIVSTNHTFYTPLQMLVESYLTNERLPGQSSDVEVVENPAHEDGPLPALAWILQHVTTRRTLMYLADEFQVDNPFESFAAVAADHNDYLGVAPPAHPRELTRGGLVYATQEDVDEVAEKPTDHPGENGLRWNGVAIFDTHSLAEDLTQFLNEFPATLAVGEIFEFRRARGRPVRALHNPDFININSPNHLLLASLYVAAETYRDQPAIAESLTKAAAALRVTM